MSKLYTEYIKRKSIDKDKYYLFKTGIFYIFIDEDAKNINKYIPLKITSLNNDIVKCGFPSNSLEKYLNVFKILGLDIEIIDLSTNKNNVDKVINKIKNIDNITPVKALYILNDLKGLLINE